MKYGVIGDMHFSCRGGDIDFLNFQLEWLEKSLKQMKEKGIGTVIQAGDFFDTRKVLDNRVGQTLYQQLPKMLEKYDMKMIIIIGNHSIFYRDNNEIHNLYMFENEPRIHIVVEHEEIDGILYLGWLNKNNLDKNMQVVAQSTAKYLVGHLELEAFPMMRGVVAVHGQDASLFKKFDKVISGHYHIVSEIGNIHYTGSPYELTWGDVDGSERGWFVFDTDQNTMELIPNTKEQTLFAVHYYDPEHKYEVSDLEKYNGKIVRYVVKDKGDTRRYNRFLEAVKAIKPIDYSIIDETIVKKSDKVEQKFDPSKMLTNMSQIVVDYSSKLAETVQGADVNVTKQITVDLYQKANQ